MLVFNANGDAKRKQNIKKSQILIYLGRPHFWQKTTLHKAKSAI